MTAQLHRWQFVNCYKVWVSIICAYPNPEELGMLAYPAIQIGLGVASLANSLRLAPTRLHIIRLVHQVGAATSTYVPTWDPLLDLLESPQLQKKPKLTTSAPPQLATVVTLSENAVKERPTQEALVVETFALLDELIDICRLVIFHLDGASLGRRLGRIPPNRFPSPQVCTRPAGTFRARPSEAAPACQGV